MAKKHIAQSDLWKYLEATYGSASKLSKAAGITTQYAYELLGGTRIPSDKVVTKLGLQHFYEVPR